MIVTVKFCYVCSIKALYKLCIYVNAVRIVILLRTKQVFSVLDWLFVEKDSYIF